MKLFILLMVSVFFATPVAAETTKDKLLRGYLGMTPGQYIAQPIDYGEVIWQALTCRNKIKNVNRETLWGLTLVEQKFNVPASHTGMLLASACYESGFNPFAKGDYRKGKPRAIGMFQLWPWWEKFYNIERTNALASAEAYLTHITRQIPKVKKTCKARSDRRVWRAAWVHAIRYPKAGGRCAEKTKHETLLRKWHRKIITGRKNYVEKVEDCLDLLLEKGTLENATSDEQETIFYDNCGDGC
tara:strand:+ start:605 stop:1333 length:729 start_codon:yes stop_codon:yes gene_type:complete